MALPNNETQSKEPLDLQNLNVETLTDEDVDSYIDARRTQAVKDAKGSIRVRGPEPDLVDDPAGELEKQAAADDEEKPAKKKAAKAPAVKEETQEQKDAAQAAAEVDEADPDGKLDADARKKLQAKFQKRLATESAKTKTERERADRLEAELAEARKPKAAAAAGDEKKDEKKAAPATVVAPVPDTDPEPLESEIGGKFKKWEDYNREYAKWAGRQALRQERAEQKAAADAERVETTQTQSKVELEARATYRNERAAIASEDIAAFKEDHDDFDTVCSNPQAVITEAMDTAIMELDEGHAAIYYYFGQNPAESKRIAGLQPFRVAREIFNLATELGAAPPASRTSNDGDADDDEGTGSTPARGVHQTRIKPIKPVGSTRMSSATSLAEETDAERYVAKKRNADSRRRSRR